MTDFRTLDRDIYFAVMGALVLMLLDEIASLPRLRSGLHGLITRRTRKSGDLDLASYVIHYAALLFSELNAKHPGCYDRCLAMNQIFADIWFCGMDGEFAATAKSLDDPTLRQATAKLREDMRYLRRDERLTIPFFAYYMNRIDRTPPGAYGTTGRGRTRTWPTWVPTWATWCVRCFLVLPSPGQRSRLWPRTC